MAKQQILLKALKTYGLNPQQWRIIRELKEEVYLLQNRFDQQFQLKGCFSDNNWLELYITSL